jgi:hypothetical protein
MEIIRSTRILKARHCGRRGRSTNNLLLITGIGVAMVIGLGASGIRLTEESV